MKRYWILPLILIVILVGCEKEEKEPVVNACSEGQATVLDIDGNEYGIVSIGNQCWMKENLRTKRYRNGDTIPTGLTVSQWYNTTAGAWAYYANNAQFDNPYGKLYNWHAVADSRGVCPTGWRVPTKGDWDALVKAIDPDADTLKRSIDQSAIAGGAMKEVGNVQSGTGLWGTPNTGATNSSGFSGLPGGYRSNFAASASMANVGYWWSSTPANNTQAWYRLLYKGYGNVGGDSLSKQFGFSVRCIKE